MRVRFTQRLAAYLVVAGVLVAVPAVLEVTAAAATGIGVSRVVQVGKVGVRTHRRPTVRSDQRGGPAAVTATGGCAHSQLSVALAQVLPAMGTSYAVFTITNTGTSDCTLAGIPGLSLTDSAGTPLPGVTIASAVGEATPLVDIPSSGEASFYVASAQCEDFNAAINPSAPTTQALTLPGDATPFNMTFSHTTQCDQQMLTVSPIVAGFQLPPGFSDPTAVTSGAAARIRLIRRRGNTTAARIARAAAALGRPHEQRR